MPAGLEMRVEQALADINAGYDSGDVAGGDLEIWTGITPWPGRHTIQPCLVTRATDRSATVRRRESRYPCQASAMLPEVREHSLRRYATGSACLEPCGPTHLL